MSRRSEDPVVRFSLHRPPAGRIALLAVLVSLAAPAPGAAQGRFTLDLGGASVRYIDTLTTAAFSLSPSLRLNSTRASLELTGTLSQLQYGGWTSQGSFGASIYSPNAGPLLGEVAASAGGSAHNDGSRTGQGLIVVRAHLLGRSAGAWLGGGGGGAWDGAAWQRVLRAEIAAWAKLGPSTALVSFTPNALVDTVRYQDVEAALQWTNGRFELSATGGLRAGGRIPVAGGERRSWGSLGAVAWITSGIGIVGSAGSFPVDLTQGFPGGTFAMLGVRLSTGHLATRPPGGTADPGGSRIVEPPGVPAEFRPVDGGVLIRIHAPAARQVEVHGDFTNWQPLALKRVNGGWWEARIDARQGTYQMNIRADGGPWLVPAGLTSVLDEFGGSVGLLVVR